MLGLDQPENGDEGTVFRDLIMLALLGFVAIVVLILPHLNPPVVAKEAVAPPGNVIVEVRWPDDLDTDVDLWVQAPGDAPVGYSNRGARIFNLLRDDLGHDGDATGLNYEMAFSRGTPEGDYTVNLHLYENKARTLPVPATVVVSVRGEQGSSVTKIASERVDLGHLGEELTVVRFSLTAAGLLRPGSMHRVPRGLRSAAATSG